MNDVTVKGRQRCREFSDPAHSMFVTHSGPTDPQAEDRSSNLSVNLWSLEDTLVQTPGY